MKIHIDYIHESIETQYLQKNPKHSEFNKVGHFKLSSLNLHFTSIINILRQLGLHTACNVAHGKGNETKITCSLRMHSTYGLANVESVRNNKFPVEQQFSNKNKSDNIFKNKVDKVTQLTLRIH